MNDCLNVVLLQHGADPNIKNCDGKTALDLADSSTRPVLTGKIIFNLFKQFYNYYSIR